MSSRSFEATPQRAVAAYIDPINRALQCITTQRLVVSGFTETIRSGSYHTAAFRNVIDGIELKGSIGGVPSRVWLKIEQNYQVLVERQGYVVKTVAYRYTLVGAGEREILAYHWHPDGRSPVKVSHFHIFSGAVADGPIARTLIKPLQDAHLPCARTAIEDVIELVIREFGVRPKRADWRTILTETRDEFVAKRTWFDLGIMGYFPQ